MYSLGRYRLGDFLRVSLTVSVAYSVGMLMLTLVVLPFTLRRRRCGVAVGYFLRRGIVRDRALLDWLFAEQAIEAVDLKAVGRRPGLAIFGDDYPTEDGTCVRDSLYVMDLADGHVASLSSLEALDLQVYSRGTGQGVSVREMVETFERVTGQRVPYRIAPRRQPGGVLG